MVLLANTLASGLEALEPTDNVSVAIDRFASAFVDYMTGSSVLGVPANSGVLGAAPKSAMIGVMGGLNTADGAATAIASGISSFWSAMLGVEATIWTMVPPTIIVPSTLIIPPGLGGLASAVQGAFDANVAGELSLSAAAATVAAAIHGVNSGASVQTQVPPTPPVVTPIL